MNMINILSLLNIIDVPIRDIVNCIEEEFNKMFPELQRLFETDLNSIAAELLAVSLLTSRVAEHPVFHTIINSFFSGFLFLRTVQQINEHCRKFFRAMYKVGGVFSLAADSVKEQLKVSLLEKFNVTLDL